MSRFLKPLRALLNPVRDRRSSAVRGPQARPRVEALEDRCLMTLSAIGNLLPSTPADWINYEYQSLGGSSGFMGQPLTSINPVGDGIGYYQQFQGGSIYYSPQTNAHFLGGAILGKYMQDGGPWGLGYPLNDMVGTSDGGFHSVFQGSSWTNGTAAIYWSQTTQASLLYGPVYQHWLAIGGVSNLGYPTWDEHSSGRGDGLGCDFTSRYGPSTIMYCTTTHSIGALWGPILQKYADMGWEYGAGYPTWDVHSTSSGTGQACDFMQGIVPTTIMFCPQDGAHPVSGAILQTYAAQGWETGVGYPMEDPFHVAQCPGTNGQDYTIQTFDTGIIYNGAMRQHSTGNWATGTWVLPSACRAYYEGEPSRGYDTVYSQTSWVGGAVPSEGVPLPNNFSVPAGGVVVKNSAGYAGESHFTGDPVLGWIVTDRNGYFLGYVSLWPSSDHRQPGPHDARLVGNYDRTLGWVLFDQSYSNFDIISAYGVYLGRVYGPTNRFEAGAAGLDLLSGFSY
jgi:hypothetical protein